MKAKKAKLYMCSLCGFLYEDKEFAQKCEGWCKTYKSCNVDITKHAIKKQTTNA